MGLDLGTLSIKLNVSDQGVAQKLDGTKKKLDDLKSGADKLEKINVNPKVDTGGIDKGSGATKKLGTELDNVGSKRVSPTVDNASIKQATDDTNKLATSLGEVAEKAVKWSAGAAAMAGIGTIGTAFTKGFQRLDALDQAEAKLEALGNSGITVQTVMDNALASVKGTAFGIGDAAGTAAVLVGAGVKPGEDLERTLKLVADSAAIAGTSYSEMGSIFGKVASSTVLSGEEMAQISDRSIGLQVALAEKFGVTAQEAKKMVSEGKVSFEDFSDAMESLVGGGAVRMGDTVSGAMDNFGAALGRAGAAVLESGFEHLPSILGAATSTVDTLTASITPLAAEWGAKLSPHLESFAQDLGPNVAAGFRTIADGAGVLTPLIGGLAKGLGAIPFPVVAGGMAALIAQQKGWTESLGKGGGQVKDFAQNIGTGLSNALSRAGAAYDKGHSKLNTLAAGHRLAAAAAKQQALTSNDAFSSMDRMGSQAASSLKASTAQIGAGFSGMARGGLSLAKSGFDGVKSAAGGLIGALGGPWGVAIMGATTLLGYLATEHFNAKKAEEEHKASQLELAGTLDATTGKISEQTEELVRKRLEESGATKAALDLGLSQDTVAQAALGNESALQRVQAAVDNATVKAVTGSDAWAKYGDNFKDAGISASTVADAMDGNTEAIRKINEAAAEYSSTTGPGLNSQFKSLSHEVDGTNESVNTMKDTILQSAEDVAEVEFEAMRNQLLTLEDQAKLTGDVLKALGDSKINLESATMISVEATEETLKAKELLDEMDGITTDEFEGRIRINFDEGYVVADALKSLGVELTKLPTGHLALNTDDWDEAQSKADILGASVQQLPDGTLALNYEDIPEATALMEALGILVRDGADGELRINNDAIIDSDKRTNDLRANVEKGMDGKAVITDNANEVATHINNTLNGKVTNGTHRIWEEYYSSGRATSTSGTAVGQHYEDGAVVEYFANGNIKENRVAQIAPAGAWRVWAEEETGGEAYIPLAPSKRKRSTNILEAVARRFGKAVVDQNAIAFADGGIAENIKSDLAYMDGTPYVFGGWTPAGVDCSGAVSLVANVATGRDAWDGRTSTHTMREFLAERGFVEGQGEPGTIRVGWLNGGPGGGHTALTLDDGTNIESGGNTGGGFTIGGPAAGGNDPQFTDFMHLPLGDQGGWSDSGSDGGVDSGFSSYGGSYSGGGSSYSGGSRSSASLSKSINGGHGPLLEDGSFLELAAAIYSQATGMPMADDITSWGNVMGLGTTFDTDEDLGRMQHDLEREGTSLRRQKAALLRDIEQAEYELDKKTAELAEGGKTTGSGKNKKFTAYTEGEILERERGLADQNAKILDLKDKLIDLEYSQEDLIKSQDELRLAIDRQTARDKALGRAGRVTPMANGGILGSLSRNAQISEGQSAVLWAEDGPEAYIPLSSNKKAKSTEIWIETGRRLGFDVMGMLNFLGSGLSGLARGSLDGFNTGGSFSLADAGLNMDAASYRGKEMVSNAVGAQFYGPVQINDPQKWVQGHLDTAQKQIHAAMKGVRNGR